MARRPGPNPMHALPVAYGRQSTLPVVWCRTLSPPKSSDLGRPVMHQGQVLAHGSSKCETPKPNPFTRPCTAMPAVLCAPQLLAEVDLANGVVQDLVAAKVVGVGAARDAHQRQVLAHRARDRVDHAQAAHREGDHHAADALRARVAVRRVACSGTVCLS